MAKPHKSSVSVLKHVTVMRAVSADYLNTCTAIFVGYLTEGDKIKEANVKTLLERMDTYRDYEEDTIDFHEEFELVDKWLQEQEAELGLKRQDYKDKKNIEQAAIIQEDMNARRTYAHYRNGKPVNWRGAHSYEEQIDQEADENDLNWAKKLIKSPEDASQIVLQQDLNEKQVRAFKRESQFSRNTTDCIKLWEAPLQETTQYQPTARADYVRKYKV